MRGLLIASLLTTRALAAGLCTTGDQSGCVVPLVSGVQANTVPSITCSIGVSLSANFGGLSGDVCYPTGQQATVPIYALFHGSLTTRDKIFINATGATMTGGLVLCAERGLACWSLDYAADTSGVLAKWQSARCGLYKLAGSGGTTTYPGNPKVMLLGGDSQGASIAMLASQNGQGFADSCDNTVVALPVYRVVGNDGPVNWAREDLYSGGTYAHTSVTQVQTIIQNILSCSSTSTCQAADITAKFTMLPYMPLAVPLYATGGNADTYVPWTQNAAEVKTVYGARFQGYAQLPGDHLGDVNLPNGTWWPWLMQAAVGTSVSGSGGYASGGSY